jgi:hypothetical protein
LAGVPWDTLVEKHRAKVTKVWAEALDQSDGRSESFSLTGEFVVRVLLVLVCVLVCYRFDWNFLRFATSESILRLSNLFGLGMQRVAFDAVQWNGTRINFTIACTFADVWCGCIPLNWNWHRSIAVNLLKLSAHTVGLFLFNILRLEAGQLLYARGVSWMWAHEVIGGLAYFVVWLWIFRANHESRSRWQTPTQRSTPRSATDCENQCAGANFD